MSLEQKRFKTFGHPNAPKVECEVVLWNDVQIAFDLFMGKIHKHKMSDLGNSISFGEGEYLVLLRDIERIKREVFFGKETGSTLCDCGVIKKSHQNCKELPSSPKKTRCLCKEGHPKDCDIHVAESEGLNEKVITFPLSSSPLPAKFVVKYCDEGVVCCFGLVCNSWEDLRIR